MAWTDDPLTAGVILRKAQHITELQEACDERARFGQILLFGSKTNLTHMYDAGKVWSPGTYPIAGPRGWPPNESPDNKFRNDHIYDLRERFEIPVGVPYGVDGGTRIPARWFQEESAGSLFDSYQTQANLMTELGLSATWPTDTELTAGSVRIRNNHVIELREACNVTRKILLPHALPGATLRRYWSDRTASGSAEATWAQAWSSAWNAWNAASWSAWSAGGYGAGYGSVAIRVGTYGSGKRYFLTGVRKKIEVDLSINTGLGWTCLPPMEADFISDGVQTGSGAPGTYVDGGLCVRCDKATTAETEFTNIGSGEAKVGDIATSDYWGTSGHDAEEFTFTTEHNFSQNDFIVIRDLVGETTGVTKLESVEDEIYLLVKPDWKWGA